MISQGRFQMFAKALSSTRLGTCEEGNCTKTYFLVRLQIQHMSELYLKSADYQLPEFQATHLWLFGRGPYLFFMSYAVML